jgi:hypothetical protein
MLSSCWLRALPILCVSTLALGCEQSTDDTGSGGTAGSGGGSVGSALIDDMEDGDGAILEGSGRIGSWYTYNDETPGATQAPPADTDVAMMAINPPRDSSAFGANTNGSGFIDWGAGFGFDLNNDGAAKIAYDGASFQGIRFFAKTGAGATPGLRVNIHDEDTAPEGGICNEAAEECYDHFGANVTLGEDWQEFTLLFADLKQDGFGKAFPAFKPDKLYAIQFEAEASTQFDIWIDDITFVE